MALLAAGWLTPQQRAASVRLPFSSSATRILRAETGIASRSRIIITVGYFNISLHSD
jgi:hypothetical protein